MQDRNPSRWAVLAIMYLCMLAFALVFQSIPPVLSLIIQEFDISYQQAGLLMSLFALPGVIISLPVGILADRVGIKRVGVVCLALTIAGSVMVATGPTFALLAAGRLIAGIGALSLVIICPQAIAQCFMNKETGTAMGVFNTAMPVGTIFTLNALAAMAAGSGWRSSIWVTVAVSVAALIVFTLFFSPPSAAGAHGGPKTKWSISDIGRDGLPIWLVGLAWGLFNASFIALFTFAPDFMVGQGLDLTSAGFNVSLLMVGSLVLGPAIGYLIDKVGRKEAFIAAGGLGMALLLVLVPGGTDRMVLLMAAIGVAAALVPVAVFSLAPDVVRPERLGLGFGIVSTVNNVGVAVGPQLVGLSRDVTGSYTSGFGTMALFALLVTAAAAALWLIRVRRHSPLVRQGGGPVQHRAP
ncbi:MAG: MFS transporter [Chloroflexi bacterium]|nr:MFS transporter [Chloroflexota bacterium]